MVQSENGDNKPKTPSKRGRPKGMRVDLTPRWKQEYMYLAWCEEPNLHHVSRVCSVSVDTARRYRDKNLWKERKAAEIQALTNELMPSDDNRDGAVERSRKAAISQLEMAAGKALEAIMTLKIQKPSDAWKMYKEAIDKKLELEGHIAPKQVNILMLIAERFQERQKKDPKDISASAEVTTVKEDTSQ